MKNNPVEKQIAAFRKKAIREINSLKADVKSISRRIDHEIPIRFEDKDGNEIF